MNASHMDAPTVPMTGLAPQRIACCGVFTICCKGSLPPDFHQHPSRGHLVPHTWRFTRLTEPRGMVPDSSVPDAPPVERTLLAPHKRRRYSCFRFAARGVCPPKKLSHFALHIQICTMPTEPRGMVQDSPIPDTPMLERTLLAPKKRRCEKRLSFGECGVHLPPPG
jgi:hypothetical protein